MELTLNTINLGLGKGFNNIDFYSVCEKRIEDDVLINEVPTIIDTKMEKVLSFYNQFHFKNRKVISLFETILLQAISNDIYNIDITHVSTEQIVISTETKDGGFKNIAIDDDGDASYMYFAKDKKKSERKLFFFDEENGLDIRELVSLLK